MAEDQNKKSVQLDLNNEVQPQRRARAVYSLRITRSRQATAFGSTIFMRFLTIEHDHDSTYGKR